MKRKLSISSIILVIYLSILACGFGAPAGSSSEVQPTYTISADMIAAFATQNAPTQSAVASPTPLPATETFTPPPTETVIPSATPSSGTSLIKNADGSHLFTDYDGGYSLLIPSEWLAVRINESEFMNATINEAITYPELQKALASTQYADPDIFRLFGYDLVHILRGHISSFYLSLDISEEMTISKALTQAQESLKGLYGEIKITSSKTATSNGGYEMGVIEYEVNGESLIDFQKITIVGKVVVFAPYSKEILFIECNAVSEFRDSVFPMCDLIFNSFVLIRP